MYLLRSFLSIFSLVGLFHALNGYPECAICEEFMIFLKNKTKQESSPCSSPCNPPKLQLKSMGVGYMYDLDQQSYPCGSKIKGECFLKESAYRHHGLYSEMCIELIKFDNSTLGSEAGCEEIDPPNSFQFNVTCDNGHWFFTYQKDRDNVKAQLNGINCFLR